MFLTKTELAHLHGVCVNTITKRVDEMIRTGEYPDAFRQPKRMIMVDPDAFDHFLRERAIKEWEKRHEQGQ